LQGKVAGVQVVNAGGTPGATPRVIIRGIGSFSNSEPLYVIDGIQGGDINSVPPQDIESITVLKDAATTAIYGTGGANGVIVITTKNGKSGKPVLSYDGSMGFSEVTKRYDMLNASQYVDLVEDIQTAGGLTITDKLRTPGVRVDGTNWQDAIFRKGAFSQHNLSLSGGTDAITYVVSTGYTNQESTIIDRDFKRATFGAKLNETYGRFKFMQNLRVKYDQNDGNLASFGDALRMPPYLSIYDPTNLGGYSRADKTTDLNDANNPFNAVYNSDYQSRDLNMNLELSGEVSLFKFLSFKSQARLSAGNNNNFTFNRPSNGGNFVRNTSDMSEYFSRYYHYILESFLVFDRTFGDDHDVNFMLGTTSNAATVYRDVTLNGSGFTNDNIQNIGLASTKSITSSNLNTGKGRLSYFTRLGYTFKNKYILNVTFRRDYSTVFGDNFKWGNFPGVGVGWNVSEENFMSNIPSISTLKVRASYGVLGNDNIAPFLTQANVFRGSSNNIVYSFGDNLDFTRGATIANMAWVSI
jgi:TonB-linked SusC/RagA family outer membrane protein